MGCSPGQLAVCDLVLDRWLVLDDLLRGFRTSATCYICDSLAETRLWLPMLSFKRQILEQEPHDLFTTKVAGAFFSIEMCKFSALRTARACCLWPWALHVRSVPQQRRTCVGPFLSGSAEYGWGEALWHKNCLACAVYWCCWACGFFGLLHL